MIRRAGFIVKSICADRMRQPPHAVGTGIFRCLRQAVFLLCSPDCPVCSVFQLCQQFRLFSAADEGYNDICVGRLRENAFASIPRLREDETMRIQRTGPDSVLLVLDSGELGDACELRRQAKAALESAGISAEYGPEFTAYSSGGKTVVFVTAGHEPADTYFGFPGAEALMDAACEAERLFPAAEAKLCCMDGRFYLATACGGAGELLREYAVNVMDAGDVCGDCRVLLAENAFQILSGRC